MPSVPVTAAAATLLLTLSAGGAQASAYLQAVAPENYATIAEARAAIAVQPPAVCGAATTAARRCVTTFVAEQASNGPDAIRWRFVGWWPADETVCMDAATADFERSCDDPKAVPEPREAVEPPLMIAIPPAPPPAPKP